MVNGDRDERGEAVFRPDDIISKSEAVKILMRVSMIEAQNTQATLYTDITEDWHKKYVENGESLGLFIPQEDNYLFYPESGVSRADMLELIETLVEMYR